MSNFNIQLKYKPCTIEILSLEDSHTVINYKQGVFNACVFNFIFYRDVSAVAKRVIMDVYAYIHTTMCYPLITTSLSWLSDNVFFYHDLAVIAKRSWTYTYDMLPSDHDVAVVAE